MRQNSSDDIEREQKQSGCFGCAGWIFALAFLGIGLTFASMLTFLPLWGMFRSGNWVETPCQVVSSDVKGNGDSLRLDLVFSYTFDNRPYQSSRYCFMEMTSNTSSAWKRDVVASHPPGLQTVCFVNPQDPSDAVMDRGWVPDMWWMFFPLPFVGIGFVGFLFATGLIRLPTAKQSTWKPASIDSDDRNEYQSDDEPLSSRRGTGPVVLKPSSTPLQLLIFSAIFAGVWNGIVSIFFLGQFNAFQKGGMAAAGWIATLFLVPFVLIGLCLIVLVVHTFLSLFNPKPTLVVDSSSVALGEELSVAWHLSGRTSSLREFRIVLKGNESATYRRGTSTKTDTAEFARIVVTELQDSAEMEQGSAKVTIPADSMHSFDASNNKIIWTLELKGDIPFWPDISASFPITVLPLAANRQRDLE